MTQAVSIHSAQQIQRIEQVLIAGDLSKLTSEERVTYFKRVCETLDLNPLTKPFEFMTLNGKLVLYALKACTDQLRSNRKVSVTVKAREVIQDCYVVTSCAKLPDGREDESTGAVSIANLKGEMLANAMMKAETKSKRRVTLSICGLGMLDETEVETVPAEAKASATLPNNGLGVYPEQPGEGNGNTDPMVHGYRIPFGKYARRGLEEIDLDQLRNYVQYLESSAERKGQSLSPAVQEFVERASQHIAALENGTDDVS